MFILYFSLNECKHLSLLLSAYVTFMINLGKVIQSSNLKHESILNKLPVMQQSHK